MPRLCVLRKQQSSRIDHAVGTSMYRNVEPSCFQFVLLVLCRTVVPQSSVCFVVVEKAVCSNGQIAVRFNQCAGGRECHNVSTKDDVVDGSTSALTIARTRQPYRTSAVPGGSIRHAWLLATETSRTKHQHQESTTHASHGVLPMRWRSRPRRLPDSLRRTQTGATGSWLTPHLAHSIVETVNSVGVLNHSTMENLRADLDSGEMCIHVSNTEKVTKASL